MTSENRAGSLLLSLFVLAVLLLGAGGHIYSADGMAQWHVARNLLAGQGPVLPLHLRDFGREVDDRIYSKFGIGESLLLIPMLLVARGSGIILTCGGPGWERLVLSFFNTGVVALSALVFYLTTAAYNKSPSVRRNFTLLLVFTTPLWHYSKTLFPEPLCALGLITAFGLIRFGRPLLAGLVWGFLLSVRLDLFIMIPCWFVFMPDRSWKNISRFVLGLIPGIILVAGYNYARFGSIVTTGFGDPDERFSTPLLLGLGGLLFSPGKSIFLYAPVLLLLPVAWWKFKKIEPHSAWLILSSALVYTVLHAKWYAWMGGWCWGPRRLVPLLPLLFVPLLMLEGRQTRWRRLLLGFGLLGLLVNFLGVAVNYNDYLRWAYYTQDTIFNWQYSPIVWHLTHLFTNGDDFAFGSSPLALVWTVLWVVVGGYCWRSLWLRR